MTFTSFAVYCNIETGHSRPYFSITSALSIVVTSLLLVCGCSSISTGGTTSFADSSKDFKSIYIIFDDAVINNYPIQYGKAGMATEVATALKKISAKIPAMWPKKFSAQGIKAEVVITSTQPRLQNFSIVLFDAPKSDLDYDLMITLISVSPGWLGMYDVNFEAILRDRKNRTGEILWKTSIELHKGLGPINEEMLSEKFADELIAQLKSGQILLEGQPSKLSR